MRSTSSRRGAKQTPRRPLPRKRLIPRTRRCQGCGERITAATCPSCRTRRATKRGNIGKRCDALWSQLVKRPGKCLRCWKTENLEAAHIIGRVQRTVRWHPWNGICLCHECHRLFDTHRIDRDELIDKAIGQYAYADIKRAAQGVWSKQYPLSELTEALKNARRNGS